MPIGLAADLPRESNAWREVDALGIHQQINKCDFKGKVMFADLVQSYKENELPERATTTQKMHQMNFKNYLLPAWGKRGALDIQPLEIKRWLASLSIANPTRVKLRALMLAVYKHSQVHGLIPRREECNPVKWVWQTGKTAYRSMILTPEQAFAIFSELPDPERTLTLLVAATGLRASEALGLQWGDVDFTAQQITIRRSWSMGQIGEPKSETSAAPVPMHPLLAEYLQAWKRETVYGKETDWVFPSERRKGMIPRTSQMPRLHSPCGD